MGGFRLHRHGQLVIQAPGASTKVAKDEGWGTSTGHGLSIPLVVIDVKGTILCALARPSSSCPLSRCPRLKFSSLASSRLLGMLCL